MLSSGTGLGGTDPHLGCLFCCGFWLRVTRGHSGPLPSGRCRASSTLGRPVLPWRPARGQYGSAKSVPLAFHVRQDPVCRKLHVSSRAHTPPTAHSQPCLRSQELLTSLEQPLPIYVIHGNTAARSARPLSTPSHTLRPVGPEAPGRRRDASRLQLSTAESLPSGSLSGGQLYGIPPPHFFGNALRKHSGPAK